MVSVPATANNRLFRARSGFYVFDEDASSGSRAFCAGEGDAKFLGPPRSRRGGLCLFVSIVRVVFLLGRNQALYGQLLFEEVAEFFVRCGLIFLRLLYGFGEL